MTPHHTTPHQTTPYLTTPHHTTPRNATPRRTTPQHSPSTCTATSPARSCCMHSHLHEPPLQPMIQVSGTYTLLVSLGSRVVAGCPLVLFAPPGVGPRTPSTSRQLLPPKSPYALVDDGGASSSKASEILLAAAPPSGPQGSGGFMCGPEMPFSPKLVQATSVAPSSPSSSPRPLSSPSCHPPRSTVSSRRKPTPSRLADGKASQERTAEALVPRGLRPGSAVSFGSPRGGTLRHVQRHGSARRSAAGQHNTMPIHATPHHATHCNM